MENSQQKSAQNSQKNRNNKPKRNRAQQKKNPKFTPPKWEFDPRFKAKTINSTKDDLIKILAEVDPDEILITSLVQQNKSLKMGISKAIQQSVSNPDTDIDSKITDFVGSPNVKINISPTCPICDKAICEVMYALHDYDHDKLAHFDCVYKKVTDSVKEKLTKNRYLAYLGSGSFGIMETDKNNHVTLIEKIYPGAPVEEMFHGGAEEIDDEI